MKLQTNNLMEIEQQAKEEVSFELGDFAYESDGSVLVAYTNKDMASSVHIYKVCAVFVHLTIKWPGLPIWSTYHIVGLFLIKKIKLTVHK